MKQLISPVRRLAAGEVITAAKTIGQDGGFDIVTQPLRPATMSPILDDVGSIWDLSRFKTPHSPLNIGTCQDRAAFSHGSDLHVADVPIKFPGIGYRVPVELLEFSEVLTAAMSCEEAINPQFFDDYYVYVTVQRTTVEEGEISRGSGTHSDSVQGPRIEPKTPIERGYSCTDEAPTCYFTHGFDLAGVDVAQDYLNARFAEQCDDRHTYQAAPYDVVLFDAYCVHAAMPAPGGRRTFIRITVSTREFDRAGNTHNALFDYNWDMMLRPLPEGLRGRGEPEFGRI